LWFDADARYYFADIDGHRYAIDDVDYKVRPEAKDFCTSLDMELVTFETAAKWETIKSWLEDNGRLLVLLQGRGLETEIFHRIRWISILERRPPGGELWALDLGADGR